MESVKGFLQAANPEYVKLFFVEKEKNEETREITYKALKTVISSEIGKEVIDYASKYISTILNHDPEYFEYGITPYSDRKHVETIVAKGIPYFDDVVKQISNPNIPSFCKIGSKIIGYVIKMQNGNNVLLLFKRYSPQKLLEKGKLFFILDTDGFERLNQDIATLDERIDALTLIENGTDYASSTVFILNRSKFESFFSFVDFYIEEINSKRITLANQQVVDNEGQLIEICKKNSIMIKKFARTLKNGAFSGIDAEKAKKIKDDFGLDVEFDENGKIIVCDDKMWTILRILDDDHLRSQATDRKYEARSKVKK